MKTYYITLILFLFHFSARADDFSPASWQPGLHLFAGGGLNSSLYTSDTERVEGGVGLNMKTDLVYFFNDTWAADWGSSVKFARIDGFLLWDTQFTLGVRRRLSSIDIWDLANPYVRVFAGKSPTVIFLDGNELPGRNQDGDVNRMQFDGTVYGVTFGSMTKTAAGTTWFAELSLSLQQFERESEIKMDGEVPVVTHEGPVQANANMYTVTFTIGALIF
ncbi:hypothetical protein AZI86_01275 [Bdellovibrio bacteriovorus]|uniref:Outer membrane protein beta-barrel domain-containing protein n=1 Tax=Bdellovibrio bacteriovorus TaxID=959 RepID=A0A150WNF7_BDEBC|nr:hypothetical protein [Bdellovibrio bacteriovorus]KYG65735.1 hypothetical protein AZI86_01275 [Bdellovibrio bacteriovorus]